MNELKIEDRKNLIDYYKWIVGIATFVITITLGFLYFSKSNFLITKYEWLALVGIILLSINIFFNWLIVKNLVILPLLEEKPNQENLRDKLIGNIKRYGGIQNTSFWIGLLSISVFFIINLW